MGQGNTKRETWEATNEEIVKHIGQGKITPDDDQWFEQTKVKSMSFDSADTDWRWSLDKNHVSQEKKPEFYHKMTCQQAIDWYVALKSDAYCLELQDKFLMRDKVDCLRNEEHKNNYCQQDSNGQWVFKDVRDLMFEKEMKLIRHVFSQAPAVDADTGAEVPVLDKRNNLPFVDRTGQEVYTCSQTLFEDLNCNRGHKIQISIFLLVVSTIIAGFINTE